MNMENLENNKFFNNEFAQLPITYQFALQAILDVVSDLGGVPESQQLEAEIHRTSKELGLKKAIGTAMEKVIDKYPQARQKIANRSEELLQEYKKLSIYSDSIEKLEDQKTKDKKTEDEETKEDLGPFDDFLKKLDNEQLD